MTALKRIWDNVTGLWSLIVGLKITGKNFADKQVTLHYPRETVTKAQLEGFRGPLELVAKPGNPVKPKCIACMMCVSACPSKCLTVLKEKAPKPTAEELQAMKEAEERGEKVQKPTAPKAPAKFLYDFTLCSLCSLCGESCPVGSLGFSSNVYLASTDKKDFKMDLLKGLQEKSQDINPGKVDEISSPDDSAGFENSTRED